MNSLSDFTLIIIRLWIWLFLLAAVFVPLERVFTLRSQRIFRQSIWTDIGYYFLSSLCSALLLGAPLALVSQASQAILPSFVGSTLDSWPLWLKVVLSLVIGDIGYYWSHRLAHEIPLLWRFHSIHHAPTELDWLVNTHGHPVDILFTRFCALLPLSVLGLGNLAGSAPDGSSSSALFLEILTLVGTIWGFFIHANLRWRVRPLEQLLTTPAFHHWHHTNDGPALINKNYAAMFPFIDRIFGSFYLPSDHRSESFGLAEEIPTGFIDELLHPFETQTSNSSQS